LSNQKGRNESLELAERQEVPLGVGEKTMFRRGGGGKKAQLLMTQEIEKTAIWGQPGTKNETILNPLPTRWSKIEAGNRLKGSRIPKKKWEGTSRKIKTG